MRSVGVTTTLTTAQTAKARIPYVYTSFIKLSDASTKDYSDRVMRISHTEGAYGGHATIVFNDYDRSIVDLTDYYVEISYGDYTATMADNSGTLPVSPIPLCASNTVEIKTAGTFTVTLPAGGSGTATTGTMTVSGSPVSLSAGSNTITTTGTVGTITITTTACYEYVATPRLWGRNQTWTSAPGTLISTLELADGFTYLSELLVKEGSAPEYYKLYNQDTTVMAILSEILTDGGFSLTGSDVEPGAGTNTADAGTNTTTLVDAALISSADDFYNDWYLYNSTRGLGTAITNYVGSTKTLTHGTIAGQTSGDSYKIYKTDEIINEFKPYFEINADNDSGATMSYEDRLEVAYRLIMQTKSYLRARSALVFDVVFPRSLDAADFTYDTTQFYRFNRRQNKLVPNTVYVYANLIWDGIEYSYASMLTGDAHDDDAITANGGVAIEAYYIAPTIDTQIDADNRAGAILTRIRAETLSASMVIQHDCRMELYDNITVSDTRGV